MFWIFFGICFVCFGVRTVYNYLRYTKHGLVDKPYVTTLIYFDMGVLWFTWFSMNFNDPVRVTVLPVLRYTGLVLFILGVSLFLFAHSGMGRLKGEDKLVTTGIFSKLRNPMYLGFMVWVVGFPLFIQSMLTLASAVLWIPHFFCWKVLEERELEKRFSEYSDYKKRTWF